MSCRTRRRTRPFRPSPTPTKPIRGDVVVYQFATASLMAPWLAGRTETLVVNYHNITPPELMAPWDHHLALGQERAREDLAVLATDDACHRRFGVQRDTPGRGGLCRHRGRAPVGRGGRGGDDRPGFPSGGARTGAVWLAVGRVCAKQGARAHNRRTGRRGVTTVTRAPRCASSASPRLTRTNGRSDGTSRTSDSKTP